MSDIASMRQPGRSSVFLLQGEYAGQPIIKEERQNGAGEVGWRNSTSEGG